MARKKGMGLYKTVSRDLTIPDRVQSYYKELKENYGMNLTVTQIAEYFGYSKSYMRDKLYNIRPMGDTHKYHAMDLAEWIVDREIAAEMHERAKRR